MPATSNKVSALGAGDPQSEATGASPSRVRIAAILVFLLTAIPYLPALRNGFVDWDDDQNFTGNADYRGLGLRELRWMWTTFHTGHYHPLTWMTWGLDYSLWGLNPVGYHLGNIVLHAINAVLVFAIARRLFAPGHTTERSRAALALACAVAAALLFSMHPLRVESVAWATERRDVLSGLFFLLAIFLYLRSHRSGAMSRSAYVLLVGLQVCALLSKAIAVTLPAVLLILDVYPLRRLGGDRGWWSSAARRVYLEKLPLILAAGAMALVAPHALGNVPQLGLTGKVAVSAYSFGFYLWKTVYPTALSPLYEMPAQVRAAEGRYLLGYASVAAAIAIAWRCRRRLPGVTAAFIAFTVTVLPVLGLVQNGRQIAADRYTYLPGVALALLAGATLLFLAIRGHRMLAALLGVIALAALAPLTWRQVGIWRDSPTLWAHAIAMDDRSPTAHLNAGLVRLRRNDFDGAIPEFERAAALKPANALAEVSWGVALAKRGDRTAAIEHYRRALEFDPTNDEAVLNWGVALQDEGRAEEAIELFQRAVSGAESARATSRILRDTEATAHANWGLALAQLGRFDAAIEHLEMALRIQPLDAKAENNLGVVLAQVGRTAEATDHYRRAMQLDSSNAEVRVNWGNVLVREERFPEAIEQYRQAAALGPASADASFNWGVALARLGRLEEACLKFAEALSLDPDHLEAEESLGRALVMLGKTEEGQARLHRARVKRQARK